MVVSTQAVTEAALQLSESERLSVASAIWKSFGATDDAVADLAAFARAQELDSGKTAPLTQAEIFAKARAALR